MGNSPTKTKAGAGHHGKGGGQGGDGRAQSPTRTPQQQQQQQQQQGGKRPPPKPTTPSGQPPRSMPPDASGSGRLVQAQPVVGQPGGYGSDSGQPGSIASEENFFYRQASEYATSASPVAPSNTPVPHPSLAAMPAALSAPPSAPQGDHRQPVRLTPDAIAQTAYNWQKPPIGQGGFSSVYEGTFYGRSVAVKVLTIRNDSERAMFEDELRALLNPALWHHNVCPLLAFCHEAPAFIFPKLSPLSLERMRRLPADVKDSVCIDVARGLAHMHAAGYVHSDMKPDNVLIEFDQNRVIRRALVGDMGCVKSCAIPVAPFGTIVFLDPALPHGVPRLPQPADDVYSLGVTFLSIFMDHIPQSVEDIRRMDYDFGNRDPLRSGLIRAMMNPNAAQRPTCAYIAQAMKNKQEELWRIAAHTAPQSAPQSAPPQQQQPRQVQVNVTVQQQQPPPGGYGQAHAPAQHLQQQQQQPQRAPPQQQQRDPRADLEGRLRRFFAHYNPEKLDNVPKVMEAFRGHEGDLWRSLTSKYGPEPDPAWYGHGAGQQPQGQHHSPPTKV